MMAKTLILFQQRLLVFLIVHLFLLIDLSPFQIF
jgi:hypothetical protein